MRKISLLFVTAIVFASCNNEGTATTDAINDSTTSTTTTEAMNYPYTIDHPDYWTMGSNENTLIALSALKAYENGDVAGCMKYFGDSVQLQFDGLDKTLAADSVQAIFASGRSAMKSFEIKMSDWESVVSKDKESEWVTLWYRQKWEDMKGDKDSLDIINDVKLKNGKIVRLDEYRRKLH